MAYKDIIEHLDALTTLHAEAGEGADWSDLAYRAQGDVVGLLRWGAAGGFSKTRAPEVIARFGGAARALDALLKGLDREEVSADIMAAVGEARELAATVAAQAPDEALGGAVELEPMYEAQAVTRLIEDDQLEDALALVERELIAAPEGVAPRFQRAVILLLMGQMEGALDATQEAMRLWPSRHMAAPGVYALLAEERPEDALLLALDGMHRRLDVQPPQSWMPLRSVPALPDEEAHAIAVAHGELIQTCLGKTEDMGMSQAQIMLIAGLLLPNMKQAYQAALRPIAESEADSLKPAERAALFAALARIERWLADFDDALPWAARAAEADGELVGEWLAREAELLQRDRELLEAGQVRLTGFGHTFALARTPSALGTVWGPEEDGVMQFDYRPDRTSAQIADMLKDQVNAWIDTGFSYTIEQVGPLDEDEVEAGPAAGVRPELHPGEVFGLLDAQDSDGLIALAEAHLAALPASQKSPAALATRALGLLFNDQLQAAHDAALEAIAASPCRACAAVHVAACGLLDADEDVPTRTLDAAIEALPMRLRSQTPEPPEEVELDGFGYVSALENDLLDGVETVAFNLLIERFTDDEGSPLNAFASAILAMMTPGPNQAVERMAHNADIFQDELGSRMQAHGRGMQRIGQDPVFDGITDEALARLLAACLTGVARWQRMADAFDEASEWLNERLEGISFDFMDAERARLARDLAYLEQEVVELRGFGVRLTIAREDDMLTQTFARKGHDPETLEAMFGVSSPDELAVPMKDVILAWLESGFRPAGLE